MSSFSFESCYLYMTQNYKSRTIFFRASNILFLPISSADLCKLNNCRHSQMAKASFLDTSSMINRDSSVPVGMHSSKRALSSLFYDLPIFFSQISSSRCPDKDPPLPIALSSFVNFLTKSAIWLRGISSTISTISKSKRV